MSIRSNTFQNCYFFFPLSHRLESSLSSLLSILHKFDLISPQQYYWISLSLFPSKRLTIAVAQRFVSHNQKLQPPLSLSNRRFAATTVNNRTQPNRSNKTQIRKTYSKPLPHRNPQPLSLQLHPIPKPTTTTENHHRP